MAIWTDEGQTMIQEVAARYGVSTDAVSMMLEALLYGGGTMAQFNIYELGGCGQWMRGGMTMVGDMFNHQLKAKVDGICGDLASAVFDRGLQVVPPAPTLPGGGPSLAANSANWWPSDLGWPSTSGGQNQYRYAYFPNARRLALSDGLTVSIYDTLDHNIGGVSQQQGGSSGISFTSQYGTVDLNSLPRILPATQQNAFTPPDPVTSSSCETNQVDTWTSTPAHSPSQAPSTASSSEVIDLIERLAKLRSAGAITDDEFNAKKTELLSRL